MKSSIIDVPRKHTEDDLFGIKKYQDALIRFIKLTDTPITIALQGEWGSGKTSLMNLLKWHLCDGENALYYPVWVNTWQYSLMKTPNQAIISILEGCINQIGALNPNKQKWEDSKKKIGGIFKKMASVGTKVAASAIGVDGEAVDGLFSEENGSSDILQLKNEIAKLIAEALQLNANKQGFTFYIDDLDRIDPPVAVEILELLKNIFDLENCVFILAIDYDVVIKGLKPKFGELTDKNEREFRSFFDKIIQLPFSMPVASYNVDTFLVDALQKIEFFTQQELEDPKLAEDLSEVARLSVGCNPRSLKRLSNTLSLISIINQEDGDDDGNNSDIKQSKIINFALVCMQIAYPYIYNQLSEEPNFKQWNENIAAKLRLRHLSEEEKESLDAAEEFDDEWEKVLFRMCQKETYLSTRAFQISSLLNKVASIINNDEQLGEIIESILELSAVTNLKAFDNTPKKVRKCSDAANEIVVFLSDFVKQCQVDIPTMRECKGKTYCSVYNKKGVTGRLIISPKDGKISFEISTYDATKVDKLNAVTNKMRGQYNLEYSIGTRNSNCHHWSISYTDLEYKTDLVKIKQICFDIAQACIKAND